MGPSEVEYSLAMENVLAGITTEIRQVGRGFILSPATVRARYYQ